MTHLCFTTLLDLSYSHIKRRCRKFRIKEIRNYKRRKSSRIKRKGLLNLHFVRRIQKACSKVNTIKKNGEMSVTGRYRPSIKIRGHRLRPYHEGEREQSPPKEIGLSPATDQVKKLFASGGLLKSSCKVAGSGQRVLLLHTTHLHAHMLCFDNNDNTQRV